MSVARQFGTSGSVRYGSSANSSILYSGTIDDDTVVTLTLEPGSIYELFTYEYNASTGAYRGHHLRNIVTPIEDLFGTTAVTSGNDFSSTNSGVTLNYPTDSTVTIARSANTYEVKYVLMAIGTSIGNVSSAVGDAEAARDQAQIYAESASASATSAANSADHYPYIDSTTGNWFVWDVANAAWVDTEVHAQGETGQTGQTGPQGVSIDSITLASGTHSPGTSDTYNVNLDDSTVAGQFTVYNGADGQGSPGSQLPLMDGTAAVGTANAYSREDHVHPKSFAFDLLWTNPSPTSSFGAQDIPVDLSDYTWFAVKYKFQTNYPHDCPLAVFSVDEENKIIMISNISTNRTGGRLLYYTVSTKKIHFNAAGYNGSATSNGNCVPTAIYGIRL